MRDYDEFGFIYINPKQLQHFDIYITDENSNRLNNIVDYFIELLISHI
jgi:hypothetical protein